jgi:hypothetical protein
MKAGVSFRTAGEVATVKKATIARIKPRSDTPHAVFDISLSSLKRGRIPVTIKPSIKINQTIHAGRASSATPTTSDTARLTSMALAVTETRPNTIANNILIRTITSELLRSAVVTDEFISLLAFYIQTYNKHGAPLSSPINLRLLLLKP